MRAVDPRLDFPDQAVEMRCDSRQLGQALTNLLQNAVESIDARIAADGENPERGRIVVAIRRNGRQIDIDVIDNGVGLPQNDRDRLTEPYVTSRKEKGTGLGLAIVKKIMEDHGGELILQDRAEGGALVRLTFTAEGPHDDDEGVGSREQALIVEAATDGV